MPTNPHYESVRAKVITACPELMKLSFGCLVKIYSYHNAPVCVRDVVEWSREIRVERFGELLKKDQYIIIGHPIRLANVIRAVDKAGIYFAMSSDGVMQDDKKHEAKWDLVKDDLAQQDPSVWEALDKMLNV